MYQTFREKYNEICEKKTQQPDVLVGYSAYLKPLLIKILCFFRDRKQKESWFNSFPANFFFTSII